jgi:hypothetical protein
MTVLVHEDGGVAAYRAEWLDGSTSSRSGGARASAGVSTTRSWTGSRARVLNAATSARAQRPGSPFYERLGWRENGRTRVVPFPPNPIDVGYTIDLETRLAAP